MNTKHNNDTPHFNIADVIIIIAIIAVIATFALRVYNIFGTNDETQEVRIEFEVASVSEENISLQEEAKLYSAEDDSLIGYLEAFTIDDAIQYAYNDKGELIKAVVPGKKTVKGTMIINCTATEQGFYLGGTRLLSQGSTLRLYTTTREMNFTIIKISLVEKDEESTSGTATTAGTASTGQTTAAAQN